MSLLNIKIPGLSGREPSSHSMSLWPGKSDSWAAPARGQPKPADPEGSAWWHSWCGSADPPPHGHCSQPLRCGFCHPWAKRLVCLARVSMGAFTVNAWAWIQAQLTAKSSSFDLSVNTSMPCLWWSQLEKVISATVPDALGHCTHEVWKHSCACTGVNCVQDHHTQTRRCTSVELDRPLRLSQNMYAHGVEVGKLARWSLLPSLKLILCSALVQRCSELECKQVAQLASFCALAVCKPAQCVSPPQGERSNYAECESTLCLTTCY